MSNDKIKKFAKFGIVLVAAITVATAAQSQVGTAQKVYADETTTEVNSTNPRMFYLKYSLSDEPGASWMRGTVVGPDGYTVHAPDDVEGYPYYTITGPEGKAYHVGDNITMEEPGLFGHANPEDDALNYLYYRSDPNASTSETPAPATSEAPSTSTTPATSEAAKPAVEKPSQKTDDKTTATEKAKDAKADKKADSKKADDKVKVEKSKDTTSEKTVATKDNSTSKTAEASAPAEQAKATVKANANVNPTSENSQAIVKQADGTVDTAAVHNDNTGFLLTMLGVVSAAFIAFKKTKKEEK